MKKTSSLNELKRSISILSENDYDPIAMWHRFEEEDASKNSISNIENDIEASLDRIIKHAERLRLEPLTRILKHCRAIGKKEFGKRLGYPVTYCIRHCIKPMLKVLVHSDEETIKHALAKRLEIALKKLHQESKASLDVDDLAAYLRYHVIITLSCAKFLGHSEVYRRIKKLLFKEADANSICENTRVELPDIISDLPDSPKNANLIRVFLGDKTIRLPGQSVALKLSDDQLLLFETLKRKRILLGKTFSWDVLRKACDFVSTRKFPHPFIRSLRNQNPKIKAIEMFIPIPNSPGKFRLNCEIFN